ncbi:hypothetical protein [Caldivirga sp.]|uniref:hypothetical protein n=1 Tax=Caldivirga sp. TaxID=2080243 RepID=UPI0025BDFF19|nr:hypothetical protein [Caldivirga sp.]
MINGITNNAVIVGTIEMILNGQDARLIINSGNVNGILEAIELVIRRHPEWSNTPVNIVMFSDGSVTVSVKLGLRTLTFTLVNINNVKYNTRQYSVILNRVRLMQDLSLVDVIKAFKSIVTLNDEAKAIIADLLNSSLNSPY